MDSEEQVLLATFLEATQLSLLTKQNISEALMMVTNDKKLSSANVSGTNKSCIYSFFNNFHKICWKLELVNAWLQKKLSTF